MKKIFFLTLTTFALAACAPNQRPMTPGVQNQQGQQGQGAGQGVGQGEGVGQPQGQGLQMDQGLGQGQGQGQGRTSSITEKSPSMQLQTKANQVPLRDGERDGAKILGYLNKGDILNAIHRAGNKYEVTSPKGQRGFVDANQVEEPAQRTPVTENAAQQGAASPAGLTGIEQQMLSLLNQERTKNGLQPLQIDNAVQKLARMKSQDMIDNNYFSHQSPTHGSPFDMLKNNGVNYMTAGENIAGNPDVNGAHTSLMNSEGHRKNILSQNFTHVGIGVKDGGQYGKMYTQIFIGR